MHPKVVQMFQWILILLCSIFAVWFDSTIVALLAALTFIGLAR